MSNRSVRLARYETITAAVLAALAALLITMAPAAGASAGCPNEQFRTGLGANLPDCRAYEQVSPQEKNGGGVDGGLALETPTAPDQAAFNGESITYGSQTAFAGAEPLSALVTTQYLSRRTPSGWTTGAITPRQELENGKVSLSFGSVEYSLFQGFSPDLEHGYLVANEPAPVKTAPPGYEMPYVRDSSSGEYTLLSEAKPPVALALPTTCCNGAFGTQYAGMSADGSHVIFEANDALTPAAIPGRDNLYEWSNGQLELVNVLPDGTVREGPEKLESNGRESAFSFGGRSEFSRQGQLFNYANAISADGKRAFWSGGNGQIYMHEITASGARTVDISATQKTNGSGPEGHDPNGPLFAHYLTANASGTLVYFTSPAALTNASTTAYVPMVDLLVAPQGDLYQYNVETGKLTDLTVDTHAGEAAAVAGLMGISEDGSYVYFAAEGVLAEGAEAIEPAAFAKGENFYVWHNGEIKWIATSPAVQGFNEDVEEQDWSSSLNTRTSRVSPNGQYLAFTSATNLTGYNTEPATTKACGVENVEIETVYYLERLTEHGKHCAEVYVYDYSAGKLICASCQPDGLPSTGNSTVPHGVNLFPPEGWQSNTQQQRYLFSNGRLFFDSTAALVSSDANDREDVYEWEPPGVGSCTGAKACVSIVSGGDSTKESQFMDADAEGNNAFFVTFDRLVASDGDEDQDLYDARIDGGLVAPAAPPCQGEACRAAAAPAPAIFGAPASQTLNGSGNPFAESFAATSTKPATKQSKAKKKPKAKKKQGKPSASKGCQRGKAKSPKRCKGSAKGARVARPGGRHQELSTHRTSGDRRGK
jgi:hypothetical protein